MNSQQSLLFLFVVMILAFSAWNAITDKEEMHDHQKFFDDVRAFMAPGDRNTAQMGYESCIFQNAIAAKLDMPLRRCQEIYFKQEAEK